MSEQTENLTRKVGTTQKDQMQILKLKSTQLKNALGGFNSRLKSDPQRLAI